jgi:7-cyano-7-deazaguanine synthase
MICESALVLFSGGLDSTTALYWARREFRTLHCLSVDYGQKHRIELQKAKHITGTLNVPHTVLSVPLQGAAFSALLDTDRRIPVSISSNTARQTPPPTYVPFRNGIFLSLAAAVAESRSIFHLVTGFNVIDSPDYPDTTPSFTRKMQEAINSGTGLFRSRPLTIHTPLIHKTKPEIIKFGLKMGADYAHSISCYRGDESPCHRCPACEIRQEAFNDLGIKDPLIQRLEGENKT